MKAPYDKRGGMDFIRRLITETPKGGITIFSHYLLHHAFKTVDDARAWFKKEGFSVSIGCDFVASNGRTIRKNVKLRTLAVRKPPSD